MSITRKHRGPNISRELLGKQPAARKINRPVGRIIKRDPATQSMLAAIVEYSDDAIHSSTLDGIIRTWNHGAENIFGYLAEEMIGQPGNRMVPSGCELEESRVLAMLKDDERIQHLKPSASPRAIGM